MGQALQKLLHLVQFNFHSKFHFELFIMMSIELGFNMFYAIEIPKIQQIVPEFCQFFD